MKIELKKKTEVDDTIWYWIYINGLSYACYSSLAMAEEAFEKLKKTGHDVLYELIKSEEV